MTSGFWNIGSFTDHIGAIVGWNNIPTAVSGTVFSNMVEQEINFVETFTSDIIDSSAVAEKYQPPIIKLTQSTLLLTNQSYDGGVSNVTLGDLKVSQGSDGTVAISKQLRDEAIRRLKELQRKVRYKRVIGGC